MSKATKGYIFGAIAAATYGMNPLFALPLYADGLKAADVLLLRYLFAVVILLMMIKARGQSLRVSRRRIGPVMALGLIMGLSSLLLFESYNYMAAGIASTMLFVYPLMVALIASLVFRVHIGRLTAICLMLATVGIALLYNGEGGATLSAVGTLLVMLSALSYAIYLVWVNRAGFSDIPTLTLTFYMILSGTAIFIVQQLISPSFRLPSTPMLWGCAIALGLLPTAVSLVCTTVALQNIGATPTAILGALEPLTAIIVGVTLFGETLTPRDVTGLALILTAVTAVIAGDNITAMLLRMRRLFPKFYHRRMRH